MDQTYRTRGYLPHKEIPGSTYFITLRLADTLPSNVLLEFESELSALRKLESSNRKMDASQEQRLRYLRTKKIQDYLDRGWGACWLMKPQIATLVQEAIRHHEPTSYITHACCIMPNHLHWILTPQKMKGMGRLDSRLIPLVQRFKSYTAHAANKILQRTGAFWSREYYDHCIKSGEEFSRLVRYAIENPVKAKLCSKWQDWSWTICSQSVQESFSDESL